MTGELAFGHGFMPRIGDGNYKAVDRCLGPPNLFAETLVLPWAIVDGPWATRKPELVSTMREHGTRTSVDTMSWRFRYEAAFGVAKLGSTSWAPKAAVSIGSRDEVGRLVEQSLLAQAALRADALAGSGVPDRDVGRMRPHRR